MIEIVIQDTYHDLLNKENGYIVDFEEQKHFEIDSKCFLSKYRSVIWTKNTLNLFQSVFVYISQPVLIGIKTL